MTADRLSFALTTLGELAPPDRTPEVDVLVERLGELRLRVLVVGAVKRGKSTLLNALLGREVLPTGVLPVTALVTAVRTVPGVADSVAVRYLSGATRHVGLGALPGLVTEPGNPGNTRGVRDVAVTLGSGHLAGLAVELVDTPGVGSVFEHNTAAAQRAYESLDAVVVVLGADPPISAEDRDLLVSVAATSLRTFVVVNKADRLSAEDREPVRRFTERVCAEAGVPGRVWLVSARDPDEGYASFRTDLVAYLNEHADRDAHRALVGHAARLGRSLRDDLLLTVRVTQLTTDEQQRQVEAFRDRLDLVRRRGSRLADLCSAAERRLLRDLGEAAAGETAGLTAGAQDQVRRSLDEEGETSPARRGDAATAALVQLVTTELEQWRQDRAVWLERALQDVLDEASELLAADVATVRQAATDLLGLSLVLDEEPIELASGRPFWFATEPPPSWELPGTELLRRRGPLAARRIRRRLETEVGPQVDKQIGRVRADLQERLGESLRGLVLQLRRNHEQLMDRLTASLDAATAALGDGTDVEQTLRRFAEAVVSLDRVLTELAADS